MLVFSVAPFKIYQNKNQNRSIDKVQNLRKESRWICKDSRQDSGHSNFSYARYTEKRFTQIYRDLYVAAMLVPIWKPTETLACEQAQIWEHTLERKERIQKRGDPAGRSLVRGRWEIEPALITVYFSFLLRLSEVKYHWSKSGKGDKTVDQLCYVWWGAINSPGSRQVTAGSTVNMEREVQLDACISNVLAKFQRVSGLNFELKKEQET